MTAGPQPPLRLGFVYPQLKRLTGAQRLIVQLASTLAAEGHLVTLVTHRLAPACRALLAPAVAVVETGERVDWSGRHLVDSALEYALSARLVGRLPGGLDATVFFGPPSLPALARAHAQGHWPLLSFCYEPPRFAYADRLALAGRFGPLAPLVGAAFAAYRPLDRWLLGRADLLLANSRFGAAEIGRVYRRPALVIDHGVALPATDPATATAVEERYGLAGAPVLLTVNHLHPRKRLDLFLAVLARVRQSQPATLGMIVGEGADRLRLERQAAALGLTEAVRWAGFVPEATLAALYQRATVYLHTGRQETFGLSVLEATAAGRPVVAVDEGGPRDILEGGVLGRLAPADPAALAEAVVTLLAAPAEARALGQRAAARVRSRFRWEVGAATLVAAVRALRTGQSPSVVVGALTERAP